MEEKLIIRPILRDFAENVIWTVSFDLFRLWNEIFCDYVDA